MSANAFTVGVDRNDPYNAGTSEMTAADQSSSSAFLTTQTFTNFTAATGAITTAWLALQALPVELFATRWCPLLLCLAWLLFSLVISSQANKTRGDIAIEELEKGKKTGVFNRSRARFSVWFTSIFLGAFNSLALFSAVIGASVVIE